MKLNSTLREHLPGHLRTPQGGRKEWHLVFLAWENCACRIELAYPDDILTENEFIVTVSDLLKSMSAGTFSGKKLDQYLALGLLIPRYRLRRHRKEGGKRVVLPLKVIKDLSYDASGYLKEIRVNAPIEHYEKSGLLIENPQPPWRATKVERNSTPLFTFSQVGQVLEIYQNSHFTLDLLNLTTQEYQDLRNKVLSALKIRLEELGSPRFCTNPGCLKPLPPDPRRDYCSEECRQKARRTRGQKSTARVVRFRALRRPFESFTEVSPLLRIE